MTDKHDATPPAPDCDRSTLLQRLAGLTQATEALKQQLAEQQQRHRDLLDGLGDGLYTMDAEGHLTYVNRAVEHMAGVSAQDLLGLHCSQWIRADNMSKIEAGRKKVLQGEIIQDEVTIKGAQGREIHLEFHSSPIRHNDNIVGTQGVLRDITARKEAEQKEQEYQKLLESLFNAITESVLVVAPGGTIKALNCTAAARLGHKPEDLVGCNLLDFFSEDVHRLREAKGREALESGQPCRFTDKRNGSVYDMTLYPASNPETQEQQLVVFARDITLQKQAEQALLESEDRYRSLMEGASDAIAMVDENGVIGFVNQKGAKSFGAEPEQLVNKTMWDLFEEPYATAHMKYFLQVMQSGKSDNREHKTCINNEIVWRDVTVIPRCGISEGPKTVLVITRDITVLKKAQEELRFYQNKMVKTERLASAGTLSAMVAHEFAQPLTVMQLSIQNALADLAPGRCPLLREDLQDCLQEIGNVTAILERFRSFAKVALDRKNVAVDLCSLLLKTVGLFEQHCRHQAVDITLNVSEALPCVWACHKDLEQLFFILIENSLQAGLGCRGCTITLSGRTVEDHIQIRLDDTCGGIAAEHIDHIFEAFYTTKIEQQGTGLGLCIVQRILEQTEGSIEVDNRPGEGVTFTVTLPVAP